ncbi:MULTISPECIES: hypothetical protein [Nannocystis]|jgi:hypothetical protein|uniref:Transposase n=1 Tax=Nannocystis radixulma TaxID=2995305 RepID=A0ABT5AZQ5_9BACT|nr:MULTISPECIES: hypothetical protein [Nannocystis]MCY1054760.1 hypothetical protein [Nannocystis sp. SCPEA4]MDC0666306.1 hypothetical protein [Nannocystis radixulma]
MKASNTSDRVRAAVWTACARMRAEEPPPGPGPAGPAAAAELETSVDRLIDDYEQLRLQNDELMREIDEIKQHTGR